MSSEQSTLEDHERAVVLFGQKFSEAWNDYWGRFAEAFANIEWEPIELPVNREQR